ncbi:MAG: 4Fe-4S dicluster domain-containing protein [Thermoflexales bacterium]|nr:4Fe-4S dicluster domain-containing protein [Thermoflexales bacterium]
MSQLLSTKLAKLVEDETGQNAYLCYQCVKCTSGCPLAEHFDLEPNQVLRMVQLGDESVLECKTIWTCAACMTCSTRCPQGLDIPAIMDTLRIEARKRGIKPAVQDAATFDDIFVRDIKCAGRMYEPALLGERNLRFGRLMQDMDMGLPLLAKGKLNLIPSIIMSPLKVPDHVKQIEPAENRIAYYPGCSLHSIGAEFNVSTQAVCRELGLELIEPEGWVCCGSSPAHHSDHTLAAAFPLKNLSLIEKSGLHEVTAPCSACYSRFKAASHEVARDPRLADAVERAIGYRYQGSVSVQHILDTIVSKIGLDKIAARVRRPLEGLRVACYYGCYYSRPPALTGAEHHEYPMTMDHLVRVLGGEPLDWDGKTSCCGGSLVFSQVEPGLEMARKVLEDARAHGADVIACICPLCQPNLDARQVQIKQMDFQMPALYVTQLMALAFGLDEKAMLLGKAMVDPRPMLQAKGLLG